jgi:hypothetical protein
MISERELAEFFHSFWQEHFPLLGPAFMRRFNVEDKEFLNSADGERILRITPGVGIERFDLVAEMAFELAIESHKAAAGEPHDGEGAIQRALKRIAAFNGIADVPGPSPQETAESEILVKNYSHFFNTITRDVLLQFRPRIKGTGVLSEMEADFCSAEVLFEVKTVNRNLQSSDLRQVIVYLVAGIGSRQYSWTDYCIFNPRRALYYKGRVDELLGYLSGRTAPEVISDVMNALMEREQPLETRF